MRWVNEIRKSITKLESSTPYKNSLNDWKKPPCRKAKVKIKSLAKEKSVLLFSHFLYPHPSATTLLYSSNIPTHGFPSPVKIAISHPSHGGCANKPGFQNDSDGTTRYHSTPRARDLARLNRLVQCPIPPSKQQRYRLQIPTPRQHQRRGWSGDEAELARQAKRNRGRRWW